MSNGMRVDGRELPLAMQEQAAMELLSRHGGGVSQEKQNGNKIPFDERRRVYTKALVAYGDRMQMTVAVEELAECQKEICKILRGGENFPHLAEEIADATIMLEQLRIMFNINEQVCDYMDQKIRRLEERLRDVHVEM